MGFFLVAEYEPADIFPKFRTAAEILDQNPKMNFILRNLV